MYRYLYLYLLLALALAGLCWGAAPAAASGATPEHTRSAKAASDLTDAQIERDIRERFSRSKISKDNFEVHVQGGVATITGRTDVLQHKGTATRMARTAGAREVRNKVQVSDAARAKARSNLRRAQVKRSEPGG